MKIKIIIILILLLSAAFFLILGKKTSVTDEHASFLGNPPEASKPYNVMDYTKPAQKQ